MSKKYNQVLTEAFGNFNARGLTVVGEGFKEVLMNAALLEEYTEQILEGVSPDNRIHMEALIENANMELIHESSIAGITPIASLSMPVIRKLWPKFAIKEAIKTEVTNTPNFVISYTKPFMYRGNDDGEIERIELVGGSKSAFYKNTAVVNRINKFGVLDLLTSTAETLDFNHGDKIDGSLVVTKDADNDNKLLVKNTGSRIKRQPLNKDLVITGVKLYDGTDLQSQLTLNHRMNVLNNAALDLYLQSADGTANRFQLFVRADYEKGSVTLVSVPEAGNDVALTTPKLVVELQASASEEFNENSWSVSFDIGRRDINVPAGKHLNASLPVEVLKDLKGLYEIDGTKEIVDLMTDTFANALDHEILEFLEDEFNSQPGSLWGGVHGSATGEPGSAGYGDAAQFSFTFDVRPASGYAGGPKQWREEIKPQIDYLAQSIRNQTYFGQGIFTLVGNPLDVAILTNVNWKYQAGAGESVDGVDVDYSIGLFQGASTYRVISSTNVAQGDMYLVFTPSTDKQMTYKYYPYQFNVEQGYVDPNRSRVPSIMMTKRHTLESFTPAIGRITIANNNGQSQFVTGAWPAADPSNKWGENL